MLTLAQSPLCISTLSVFYNSSPWTFQDNDPSPNLVIPYGSSVTFRTKLSIENMVVLLHVLIAPWAAGWEPGHTTSQSTSLSNQTPVLEQTLGFQA